MGDRDEVTELALAAARGDRVALSELIRQGRSSARTWLFAIARRVVVDRRRHDNSRPQVSGLAAPATSRTSRR